MWGLEPCSLDFISASATAEVQRRTGESEEVVTKVIRAFQELAREDQEEIESIAIRENAIAKLSNVEREALGL